MNRVSRREDQPDSTDRWLEEVGGGGRRESLASDPPHFVDAPKPPRLSTRGGRPFPEKSGVDMTLEFDNNTQQISESDKQIILRSAGHIAFLAGAAESRYRAAIRDTNGDPQKLAVLERRIADGKF